MTATVNDYSPRIGRKAVCPYGPPTEASCTGAMPSGGPLVSCCGTPGGGLAAWSWSRASRASASPGCSASPSARQPGRVSRWWRGQRTGWAGRSRSSPCARPCSRSASSSRGTALMGSGHAGLVDRRLRADLEQRAAVAPVLVSLDDPAMGQPGHAGRAAVTAGGAEEATPSPGSSPGPAPGTQTRDCCSACWSGTVPPGSPWARSGATRWRVCSPTRSARRPARTCWT